MSKIRKQFESEGYVILEDFLSQNEVNELIKESQILVDNRPEESKCADNDKDQYLIESADKVRYFFEPNDKIEKSGSLFRIGHAIHALNPVFRQISFDERVKESCFQLNYDDPVIVQSALLFKKPSVGGEGIHQDAWYFHTDPVKLVGFWIALQDCCLWINKGSHKSGAHRRYVRNPDKDSNDLIIYDSPQPHYQKNSFTSVPVEKGTCVLIHGLVVYYNETGKSDETPLAYTFHVVEQKNTKWSENNWIQMPDGKSFLQVYRN